MLNVLMSFVTVSTGVTAVVDESEPELGGEARRELVLATEATVDTMEIEADCGLGCGGG
jgi:hypothetical protein